MCLSPSWCVLCKEDIDHILIHCQFAQDLWIKMFNLFGLVGAMPKRWVDVIAIKWSFKQSGNMSKCIWSLMVLAIAWTVWLERNRRIFYDRCNSVEEVWNHSIFLVGLWARALNVLSTVDRFMFALDCNSFMS